MIWKVFDLLEKFSMSKNHLKFEDLLFQVKKFWNEAISAIKQEHAFAAISKSEKHVRC